MAVIPVSNIHQARQDLEEHGYCLLENAMSPDTVAALRDRLTDQARAEKAMGEAFEDGGPDQQWGSFTTPDGKIRVDAFREANGGVNQRVWMLVNKGQIFVDLLSNPAIQLAHSVLGEHMLLSSYTANIARPGGVAMELHTDQWWMPPPAQPGGNNLRVGSMTRSNTGDQPNPSMIAPAACSNIIWMLDDFTTENGATRVVPGSHRAGRHPDPAIDADVNVVQACAPAGTALVTDGRTWHGTGANSGDTARHAVLTTFCGPQFRTQENFVVGTRQDVVDAASPELLELLGFRVWCGYGRTGHPTEDIIDRTAPPLGPVIST